MKYLLLFSFLIIGCVPNHEYRVVCDNFETPWMDFASTNKGIVYWSNNSGTIKASRKMLLGESCQRETQNKI